MMQHHVSTSVSLINLSRELPEKEKYYLQQVVDLALKGYTCAQIIYRLIVRLSPQDDRDEAVTRALGVFNRGIASYGEICGIVVGGAAALSSLSPMVVKSTEDPMWRIAQFFIEEFESEIAISFGSIHCSTIRSNTARRGENTLAVCAVLLARAVAAMLRYLDNECTTYPKEQGWKSEQKFYP